MSRHIASNVDLELDTIDANRPLTGRTMPSLHELLGASVNNSKIRLLHEGT